MSSAIGHDPSGAARLSLLAEALQVERVRIGGDRVEVRTVTREAEHVVDEAVSHERIDVERVAIGRPIVAVPDVREEDGVTILPVVEEILVVERRLVLKEEIRIRRVRVEAHHRETVILRVQDATVTRTPTKSDVPPTEPQFTHKETNMTEETIVAIYDTAAHAEAAVRDLKAGNVPASAISLHANTGSSTASATTTATTHDKGFWASLFGSDHEDQGEVYGRSVEAGSTVVSVKVASEHYDHVAAIMEKHNPVDVEERTSQYGLTGSSDAAYAGVGMAGHGGKTEPARSATEAHAIDESGLAARAVGTKGAHGTTGVAAETGEGVMQLAAEALNVGKRAVQGGTTRIRRFTVSKPVEEQVTLHNEKVVLDRKPITDGRILTNADFTDKSISMTETNEEAVVSKTARVVEELGLRKEAGNRVETVRDTLRHDEVEVEQVPVTEVERVGTTRTTPVDRKI